MYTIFSIIFFENPTKVRYLIKKQKKLSLYIIVGFSLNYYIKTYTKTRYYTNPNKQLALNTHTTGPRIFKDVIVSSALGLGINYQLTEKYYIFFQPELRYYHGTGQPHYNTGLSALRSAGLCMGLSLAY